MKYLIPETIETQRLVLRQFTEEDVEPFCHIMQKEDVVRYIDNGRTLNEFECWHHIAMQIGHWHFKGFGSYALLEKASNTLIGKIGLYAPHNWTGIECKWLLDTHFQKKGFAYEASTRLINECFKCNLTDTLVSIIHPENKASIKLATKLNMFLLDSKEITNDPSLFYCIKKQQ